MKQLQLGPDKAFGRTIWTVDAGVRVQECTCSGLYSGLLALALRRPHHVHAHAAVLVTCASHEDEKGISVLSFQARFGLKYETKNLNISMLQALPASYYNATMGSAQPGSRGNGTIGAGKRYCGES